MHPVVGAEAVTADEARAVEEAVEEVDVLVVSGESERDSSDDGYRWPTHPWPHSRNLMSYGFDD
jgi:hypothetical protein